MPDDYAGAAKRHFEDAEHLAGLNRFDNAGHLMGFAGECAMKKKLRDLNRQPAAQYDGHHPKPQTMIRSAMNRRGMNGPWLSLCAGPVLFSNWSVDQRYLADNHVDQQTYAEWKKLSARLISLAQIR
jgi:hypothetical protein